MTQPCMRPCKSFEIMRPTNVTMMNEQISYEIRGNFNCQSENVVYALICSQHELKYIGERLTNHKFKEPCINNKT